MARPGLQQPSLRQTYALSWIFVPPLATVSMSVARPVFGSNARVVVTPLP